MWDTDDRFQQGICPADTAAAAANPGGDLVVGGALHVCGSLRAGCILAATRQQLPGSCRGVARQSGGDTPLCGQGVVHTRPALDHLLCQEQGQHDLAPVGCCKAEAGRPAACVEGLFGMPFVSWLAGRSYVEQGLAGACCM